MSYSLFNSGVRKKGMELNEGLVNLIQFNRLRLSINPLINLRK